MSVNPLTNVRERLSRTPSYLIGSHRVLLTHKEDHCNICNGLTLWVGILLDHDLMLGSSYQEHRGFTGRVLSLPILSGSKEVDLTPLLVFLDDLDSALIREISGQNRFKGDFLYEVTAPINFGVVVHLCRKTVKCLAMGELSDLEAVRLLHQSFSFLKKIELDRPDLLESAKADYLDFEKLLEQRECNGFSPFARQAITEMRALARKHLRDFSLTPFRPEHGPGAVSDTNVKCWYDKYLHMKHDARIAYLLNQNCLGTIMDYCPWCTSEKSDRTCRYVAVPKTWKKLRGISAEPIELQFFQHAIFNRIDALFTTNSWWRQRVDLHDQTKSRKLAIAGSLYDNLATIDLSAASDSVTLELVKQVFKGTKLLYWLLGTRSTYSVCDEQTVRMRKFAPMGSACCFPVECIVFTLAAQVASDRTYIAGLDDRPTVRVFGDDIIIDGYAAHELIHILEELGFTVNTDKSYTSGGFREACGAEAYRGDEIQPLRYKRLDWDPSTQSSSAGSISTSLSYINSLYLRGYHTTREYLLHGLLHSKITVGKHRREVGRYLSATFHGLHGTFMSSCPTNFNRLFKFDREYQTIKVLSIGFRLRLRSKIKSSVMTELFSMMRYHEWQLGHQPGLVDFERRWEKGWIDLGAVSDLDSRIPLGFVMTPTEKWKVWTEDLSYMS